MSDDYVERLEISYRQAKIERLKRRGTRPNAECACIAMHGMALCTGGPCPNAKPVKK